MVTLAGEERPHSGVSSALQYGGVASTPLDARQLDAAVRDPKSHFKRLAGKSGQCRLRAVCTADEGGN